MAGRNDWETPRPLIRAVEAVWGPLLLDVCASGDNTKACEFIGLPNDGLSQTWDAAHCWMNPPYTVGKRSVIGDWVDKAIKEAERGAVVTALLINDPSTKWFRRVVDNAAEIRFLLGPRIRFEIDGKAIGSGTQSHVIARFHDGYEKKDHCVFWDWRAAVPSIPSTTSMEPPK